MSNTNYETVVPRSVRVHVEELMERWRSEGRPDDAIENIVRSAALAAYSQGATDGEGPYCYCAVGDDGLHDPHCDVLTSDRCASGGAEGETNG